jgi:hypothetical protein
VCKVLVVCCVECTLETLIEAHLLVTLLIFRLGIELHDLGNTLWKQRIAALVKHLGNLLFRKVTQRVVAITAVTSSYDILAIVVGIEHTHRLTIATSKLNDNVVDNLANIEALGVRV